MLPVIGERRLEYVAPLSTATPLFFEGVGLMFVLPDAKVLQVPAGVTLSWGYYEACKATKGAKPRYDEILQEMRDVEVPENWAVRFVYNKQTLFSVGNPRSLE